MEPITGSTRPASDFFATVLGTFEQGLSRIGSEILPNWVGQQLLDQEKDMLYQPTNYLQPANSQSTIQAPVTPTFFDRIGTQITGGAVLLMALIGAGAYLYLRES